MPSKKPVDKPTEDKPLRQWPGDTVERWPLDRIATFELQTTAPHPDDEGFWPDSYRVAQIKGPCNATPVPSAIQASYNFLEAIGGIELK